MTTVGATICVYVAAVMLAIVGDIALIYFGKKVALTLFQPISPRRRSLQRAAVYAASALQTAGVVLLWLSVVLFVPIGTEWAALVVATNVVLVMSLRILRRKATRRADAAIESYAIVPQEE